MRHQSFKAAAAFAAAAVLCISALPGCAVKDGSSGKNSSSAVDLSIDKTVAAEDLDVGYDETESCKITLNGTGAEIQGAGAESENGIITISKAGTYLISGSLSGGRIIVSADKESEIKMVLNGAEINCSDYAPIYVEKAKKVYITLEDGTENSLTDGKEYSLGDEDSNVDGAIFSKADLTLNGGGKLSVTSNYKHAVVCKDNLVITDGSYEIISASSGIVGKDSVKISGGTFNISSQTNGIKASNDEETDKGFISVTGGEFTFNTGGDGFEAETELIIDGGIFNVTTGGGSANASMKEDGTPNGDWQKDMGNGGPMGGGFPPQDMGTPPDGQQPDMRQNDAVETTADTSQQPAGSDESETTSAKAFKAGTSIKITKGDFTIDSADDSIHSNGTISISGGKISASSGDDGIHGDSDVVIDSGEITISKSYEGIEGMTVTINGGNINVTASDDGINCAGGSDTGNSSRPGMDMFTSQEGVYLKITGGTITVDASGDGLDSNGDLYVEGGTVYVYGPTNDGNGALDYNGTAVVTGGTVAAFGASGMAQGFSDESEQYSFLQNLSSSAEGGQEVKISDSSGKILLTCTPAKQWNSVVFTCPELADGETYTVSAGEYSENVTLSGMVTSNGQGGMMGGPGGGGRGGMGRENFNAQN